MNLSLLSDMKRAPLALLALSVVACGGCSGINASKSISPLDFLLPGLHIRNDSPPPATPDGTNAPLFAHPGYPPPPALS
jgi:hypothetical protein